MAEYYIDTLQDYLEALAVAHVDVQHTKDGQSSFAHLFSGEEMEAISNNAGRNIVVVSQYNGRAIGHADEQRMRQQVMIRFASYAESVSSDAIKAAVHRAWVIMMDFVARLRQDKKTDDCGPLSGLQLSSLSWDEIPDQPFLDNHYGWELTIPYDTVLPQFDAARWSEPQNTLQ